MSHDHRACFEWNRAYSADRNQQYLNGARLPVYHALHRGNRNSRTDWILQRTLRSAETKVNAAGCAVDWVRRCKTDAKLQRYRRRKAVEIAFQSGRRRNTPPPDP